MENKKLSIKR